MYIYIYIRKHIHEQPLTILSLYYVYIYILYQLYIILYIIYQLSLLTYHIATNILYILSPHSL